MRMIRNLALLMFIVLNIFVVNDLFAQSIDSRMISQGSGVSSQPGQGSTAQRQLTSQHQTVESVQVTVPAQQKQVFVDKPSEFEQYISNRVIKISQSQLNILRKLDGVTFQHSNRNLKLDQIALPVRIYSLVSQDSSGFFGEPTSKTISPTTGASASPSGSNITDAGYIVGTKEAISSAFKLIGVKAPRFVSTELKQFGYDLFEQPSTVFEALYKVPVGPDYVVGPGDEVRISLWGSIEGNLNLFVDRDGNITIPKVGVVNVTGLNLSEMKDFLHKEVSKYYTNFHMNVSMGSLRTIRIYMVGSARVPGSYNISSLSTLVSALFETGGPAKTGSMRHIEVKRHGKTVREYDLYELFLNGDKSQDIKLLSEDVIFIPPVGPIVAIAGSVNRPGIYELKGETSLYDLINMAGGLNAVAFRGRVQIERIVNHNTQVIFESDLAEIMNKSFSLQSGDVLKVFQVTEDKRGVKLVGAVNREGEYGLSPGMTIKDLINLAGGLKYYAYTKEAELTRRLINDSGTKTEKIKVNLEQALKDEPNANITLKEDDYLFIKAVPEWRQQQLVTIQGEVRFPGTYPIKKGERISSLIERAGGYTDNAYLRGAYFTRERLKELQQKNMDEMVARLERDLFSAASSQVSGSLSTEEVAARKAEVEQKRKFIDSLKQLKATGRLSIILVHLRLLKGSEFDIKLEDGDSLTIPTTINVVNVAGSVMHQGSFLYNESMSVNDYIEIAGGATNYADTKGTYILKIDGSAMKASQGIFSWNSSGSRWEVASLNESFKEIEPGDTIIVPEKLERIAWLREIKDITQIIANLAISAGVVKALY